MNFSMTPDELLTHQAGAQASRLQVGETPTLQLPA